MGEGTDSEKVGNVCFEVHISRDKVEGTRN
jgi:hypothetical protein